VVGFDEHALHRAHAPMGVDGRRRSREAVVTDLECLRAACAGRRSRAARRGRALVDASLSRNLRLWREIGRPAGDILDTVARRWPKILRGLRREVRASR
jgi:hypothetical protein